MIPAVALAVAALFAGHPTQVACDVPETAIVYAWTTPGTSVTHMRGSSCVALAGGPTRPGFAVALTTLLHESAHARGVRSEDCAEMWATTNIAFVLEAYYNVPLGSSLALRLVTEAVTDSRSLPAAYQPNERTCEGEPL